MEFRAVGEKKKKKKRRENLKNLATLYYMCVYIYISFFPITSLFGHVTHLRITVKIDKCIYINIILNLTVLVVFGLRFLRKSSA